MQPNADPYMLIHFHANPKLSLQFPNNQNIHSHLAIQIKHLKEQL